MKKMLFMLTLGCSIIFSYAASPRVFINFNPELKKPVIEPGVPKIGDNIKPYLNTGRWEMPSLDNLRISADKKNAIGKACFVLYHPATQYSCRMILVYDCNTAVIYGIFEYP